MCKTATLKKTKIGFQDQLSLNAGQKYCRMLQGEHSAILWTFIKIFCFVYFWVAILHRFYCIMKRNSTTGVVVNQKLISITSIHKPNRTKYALIGAWKLYRSNTVYTTDIQIEACPEPENCVRRGPDHVFYHSQHHILQRVVCTSFKKQLDPRCPIASRGGSVPAFLRKHSNLWFSKGWGGGGGGVRTQVPPLDLPMRRIIEWTQLLLTPVQLQPEENSSSPVHEAQTSGQVGQGHLVTPLVTVWVWRICRGLWVPTQGGWESWLLYFNCLDAVLWLLVFCGSSSWSHGLVCSVWLWYYLVILTFWYSQLSLLQRYTLLNVNNSQMEWWIQFYS